MKIDSDLRLAIRSAIKNKPTNWVIEKQQKQAAISDLMERNKLVRACVSEMRAIKLKIKTLSEQLDRVEKKTGLRFSYGDTASLEIRDDARFEAAGGKLPIDRKPPTFDGVMAQIAAAPDSRVLNAILKHLNIIWK